MLIAGPILDALIHARVMNQSLGQPPAYSTDRWTSYELMGQMSPGQAIGLSEPNNGPARCSIYYKGWVEADSVEGPTGMLAICKMALKVKGIPEPIS